MPDRTSSPPPPPAGTPRGVQPTGAGRARLNAARMAGPQIKANPALVKHAGASVHATRPSAPAARTVTPPVARAVPAATARPAPLAATEVPATPAPRHPGALASSRAWLQASVAHGRKAVVALPGRIDYWRRYSTWWLRNLPYWLYVHRRQVREARKWGLILLVAIVLWAYFGVHSLSYRQVYPLMVEDDVTGATVTLKITGYIPDRQMVYVQAKAWEEDHRIYLQLYGRRVDPFGLLGWNDRGTVHDSVTVPYLKRGVYPILYRDKDGVTKKLKQTEV